MHRRTATFAIIVLAFALAASSSLWAASAQIKQLESALEVFRMDHGIYPTTEEGLAALVSPPPALRGSSAFPAGGYLRGGTIPLDPWGSPFQYRSPATRSSEGYDVWSLGADGAPGGAGLDADGGNWPDGFAEWERATRWDGSIQVAVIGGLVGAALGLPIYLFGFVSAVRGRRTWRSAAAGAPLAVVIYLAAACSALSCFLLII